MTEYISFIQENGVYFLFKALLLILMIVYALFTFIVYSRVRALNRTIQIASSGASAILQLLSLIIVIAAVSLFVITLVIV